MMNQVELDYDQTKPLSETRPYEIKQIEMNMIAASFQGLSSIMPDLHRLDVLNFKMILVCLDVHLLTRLLTKCLRVLIFISYFY